MSTIQPGWQGRHVAAGGVVRVLWFAGRQARRTGRVHAYIPFTTGGDSLNVQTGLYGQARIKLLDPLTVVGGARFTDFHTKSHNRALSVETPWTQGARVVDFEQALKEAYAGMGDGMAAALKRRDEKRRQEVR